MPELRDTLRAHFPEDGLMSNPDSVPMPNLRIVPTSSLFPHEEHDSQRSAPLAERLRTEAYVINPPVVAALDDDRYVILDGANRCHAFEELGYPHIIVQVSSYESGEVDLQTWNHVVSAWDVDQLMDEIADLAHVEVFAGNDLTAPIHILLRDGRVLSVQLTGTTLREQNAATCMLVRVYQQRARLNRTAIREAHSVFELYPDAVALVRFPLYTPLDILAAARDRAYLPPGVSRHIIQGRALRINYPIERLRDTSTPLVEKNHQLREWFQRKLANRQIRFYAEATYQFDE
jgi:hypothetical protein